MKLVVTCKNCRYWEPWKLPQGKTLMDMTKMNKSYPTLNSNAKRGDCRNDKSEKGATYSSTTCDFAEAKDEKED